MASGWDLWVWLKCLGVVSRYCCKEVRICVDFLILLLPTPLVLALFLKQHPIPSLFILKMFFRSLL